MSLFAKFLTNTFLRLRVVLFFLWRYIWSLGKQWTLWSFLLLDVIGLVYVMLPIAWNIPPTLYIGATLTLFFIANIETILKKEYKVITKSEQDYVGHTFKVNSIALSPDGIQLVSSSDRIAIVWDIHTAHKIQKLQCPTWLGRTIFVRAGREVIAIGGKGKYFHWDVDTGELLHRVQAQETNSVALAIMDNEKCVATAGKNGIITIWEFPKMKKIREHHVNGVEIRKLSYVNDNALIACDVSGEIIGFTPSGRKQWSIFQHPEKEPIRYTAFSPSKNRLAFVDGSGDVYCYDMHEKMLYPSVSGHSDMALTCEFNATGDFLATGGQDNKIVIWRVHSNRLVKLFSIHGHTRPVLSLAFEKQKNNLFSSSMDNKIKYWQLDFLLYPKGII